MSNLLRIFVIDDHPPRFQRGPAAVVLRPPACPVERHLRRLVLLRRHPRRPMCHLRSVDGNGHHVDPRHHHKPVSAMAASTRSKPPRP